MKQQTSMLLAALGLGAGFAFGVQAEDAVVLRGFASIPADTFAPGPPSGGNPPIEANGRTGPFVSQPVQGFSGVQFSGIDESFWFLSDNGFGSKSNSSDYLLRVYRVDPNFKGLECGGRLVTPDCSAGGPTIEGFIQLADPDRLVPFPIVREGTPDRLLTGADFDVESFVFAANGDIWIGEEFGPFLLHFDGQGRLLEAPIRTPDLEGSELSTTSVVRSPDDPELAGAPNLPRSRGFEGMAFSVDRRTLYPLLEGTVTGDPAGSLRIYAASVDQGRFVDFVGFYPLSDPGHAIGDFTPVNDREFLVIERDNGQGASAKFKKIFLVDFSRRDAQGVLAKREAVDLLAIADPMDLNQDGSTSFDFPFVTIEDVVVLTNRAILVANDNNYPFSVGRGPDIDNNEMIVLELPEALDFDARLLPETLRSRVRLFAAPR